ncbi:hypothetical protein [Mangrovibacterium lignilyticum]|uniref:hypothetical protein n=1 Tax=Mangrovibacterium lignilyticum TaxID=2668052 RepID=UPI0013D5A141|nr:hypothetical protein [Mangrovibacterium lignilyticum]
MELINYTRLTPTFGGSFSNGWEVMKKYFMYLLLVVIIVGFFKGPSGGIKFSSDNMDWHLLPVILFLAFIGVAYAFLVMPVITYGSKLIYLDAVRDKEIDIKKMFDGFRNYLNVILANLLHTVLIFVGILFFIIPGIVIACRLAFVPYLVMDENLDGVQAIERSWKLTKGKGFTILFMAIASFFIGIAGIICLIVGILPALIWIHSSFASLYQAALNKENGTIDY